MPTLIDDSRFNYVAQAEGPLIRQISTPTLTTVGAIRDYKLISEATTPSEEEPPLGQ